MTTPLLPYSSIRRRKKKRAGVRVGKVSGKIRLYGAAKTALRDEVYLRDGGRCQICKAWLPKEGSIWVRAHMAHKTSLGAGGSDTPENCWILCYRDHIVNEHTKGLKIRA